MHQFIYYFIVNFVAHAVYFISAVRVSRRDVLPQLKCTEVVSSSLNMATESSPTHSAGQTKKFKRKKPKCTLCKQRGHFTRNCPNGTSNQKCGKCKQRGHIKRDCPKRRHQQQMDDQCGTDQPEWAPPDAKRRKTSHDHEEHNEYEDIEQYIHADHAQFAEQCNYPENGENHWEQEQSEQVQESQLEAMWDDEWDGGEPQKDSPQINVIEQREEQQVNGLNSSKQNETLESVESSEAHQGLMTLILSFYFSESNRILVK